MADTREYDAKLSEIKSLVARLLKELQSVMQVTAFLGQLLKNEDNSGVRELASEIIEATTAQFNNEVTDDAINLSILFVCKVRLTQSEEFLDEHKDKMDDDDVAAFITAQKWLKEAIKTDTKANELSRDIAKLCINNPNMSASKKRSLGREIHTKLGYMAKRVDEITEVKELRVMRNFLDEVYASVLAVPEERPDKEKIEARDSLGQVSDKLYKKILWQYRKKYFLRALLITTLINLFAVPYSKYTLYGVSYGFGRGIAELTSSRTFGEFIMHAAALILGSAIAGFILSLLFWPLAKSKAQLEAIRITSKNNRRR